jgi:hypothetical protein
MLHRKNGNVSISPLYRSSIICQGNSGKLSSNINLRYYLDYVGGGETLKNLRMAVWRQPNQSQPLSLARRLFVAGFNSNHKEIKDRIVLVIYAIGFSLFRAVF